MRRILFITRSTNGIGGMQTYTRTLLKGLGHDASIHLTVVAWTGPKVLLPFFIVYACVRAILFRGDVCHIGDGAIALIALPTRFFRRHRRLTLTTYGLDVIYPSRFYQWILRRSLPLFDVIVTISHATSVELQKRSVHEDRIVMIVPGIDVPVSRSTRRHASRHQLLILGRQIKRKGTAWFLSEVLPTFVNNVPSMTVMIAGDGPELPHIRAIVAEKNLQDSVSVLGSIDDEQKVRLLQESTLMVVPNISVEDDIEGFGLVCTEALVHGLPVVASKREGLIDAVVERETGVFFESGNAKSAVLALTEALQMSWDSSRMHLIFQQRYSREVMCSLYRTHVF